MTWKLQAMYAGAVTLFFVLGAISSRIEKRRRKLADKETER